MVLTGSGSYSGSNTKTQWQLWDGTKRKQTTPRRVVSKTSASQVSAKAPSANNQRQRVALQVYRNRHSEIVRQTVCNVWTAYQLDCISLGEPGTRDSQDEGDQNCPYCQCQKQEEIQPMSGENVTMWAVLFPSWWKSSINVQLLHLALSAINA